MQTMGRYAGAKFSPGKYQLCHITRKRVDLTEPLLINGSSVVKAERTMKYLGALFDSKFNWKAHFNMNKTKA